MGWCPTTWRPRHTFGDIAKTFPNGAKVALYYVNTDFGKVYADTLKEVATDNKLEIVDEQTIEAGNNDPPTSQLTSITRRTRT